MPPEYAVDGLFSIKSDVFSFGVLVLEILSGKKNRGFVHQDHSHNLLGHVSRKNKKLFTMLTVKQNVSHIGSNVSGMETVGGREAIAVN